MNIEPVSAALGAVVTGMDLRTFSREEGQRVQAALDEYLVLFFRDQQLDAGSLAQAASRFGTVTPYPFVKDMPGFPGVIEVKKLPDETENFGGVWHTDTPYLPEPAAAAMLYGDVIPTSGGDTLFANMYDAYDALSPGLKTLLGRLRAHFDADKAAIAATRQHRTDQPPMRHLTAEHPVVRTHPRSGRKLLYVSRAHTTRFVGWTEAESQDLLAYLFDQQNREEFTCRFSWTPGSVAFWDNRACQHYPLNDYPGELRRMLRVSLAGEAPV